MKVNERQMTSQAHRYTLLDILSPKKSMYLLRFQLASNEVFNSG